MLTFIHANQAAFAAIGTLIGTFAVIAYLNIAYANEKKQEDALRNTDPIHRTCALDTTLQDREFANKLIDSTMKAGFGIAEAFLVAALKPPAKSHS